jgi:hypothetical protein
MISEAVHHMKTAEHVGRDSEERRLMHAIDRLLFELEECNLIGLRQPPPELRVRCLSALAMVTGRHEASRARTDDGPSLMDRLFAAQHELMRRQRRPEFKELANDHD